MPFLNVGRSGTALLWAGSRAIPDGIEIGTGSSTKTVLTTGLTTPVYFKAFTGGSGDTSTPQQVLWTADIDSVTLSGLTIREIAVKKSGGSYWSADGFPGIPFDGGLEMQVLVTWVVF